MADRVRLPGWNDPKTTVLRLVRDWLDKEENEWTMVVDNADDMDVFYMRRGQRAIGSVSAGPILTTSEQQPIVSFLPQSYNGSIVITSRSMDVAERLVGGHRNIIPVPVTDSA